MTLVIGKIQNNSIFIESDTRITDKLGERKNPLLGTLKTIIINPYLTISFAGNVYLAKKAIEKIISNDYDLDTTIKVLQECNIDSMQISSSDEDSEVDFLVSILKSQIPLLDLVPKMIKISNGRIESDMKTAWIGDKQGFNLFQKEFHSLNKGGKSGTSAFRQAFKSVVENENIESIGNFQISLNDLHRFKGFGKVFMYSEKTEYISEKKTTLKLEANKPVKLSLGCAADGSYGISYLVSFSPIMHGVALHFPHGNFGVLFCPQISNEGIILRNLDGKEFVNEIKNKFNLQLKGFIKLKNNSIQYVK